MTNQIKFEKVEINDNEITVTSPSTVWFNVAFKNEINVFELVKRYNELVKKAKSRNIKVSQKYKTKQSIIDNSEAYMNEFNKYSKLYKELKNLVAIKIEKGINIPASDDKELDDLYEIRNKMISMFHGSRPLSVMGYIEHTISQFEQSIIRNESLHKIYL